jgi:hypothetical protein
MANCKEHIWKYAYFLGYTEYNFLHFSCVKCDAKEINKGKSKHCHKIIYFVQAAIQ